MQLKRFQAATVMQAYEQVRRALGDDAVIVSTRSTEPGAGPASREVEVVAGLIDGDPADASATLEADAATHDLVRGVAEATATAPQADFNPLVDEPPPGPALAPPFVNAMAGIAREGRSDVWSRIASTPRADRALSAGEGDAAQAPVPGVDSNLLQVIAAEVREMRSAVERFSLRAVNELVDAGPDQLSEVRARLIEQGVAPSVLVPVLDRVAASVVAGASPEAVWGMAERLLASQLPPPASLTPGETSLAVFIVGLAGAGKTSVAVRLARDLTARGVATALGSVDVRRAGAPQHLSACGAAAGLVVHLCYSPGELRSLLTEDSARVVVVDTPGNAGEQSDGIAELMTFAGAAPRRATLLALPATAGPAALSRAGEAFAGMGVDGLVLTHCDLADTFGAVVNAACDTGTGVAYTSDGGSIERPLSAGDNRALAEATLGGRWPQPEAARPASMRKS